MIREKNNANKERTYEGKSDSGLTHNTTRCAPIPEAAMVPLGRRYLHSKANLRVYHIQ